MKNGHQIDKQITIIIIAVDKHHHPGGHWNDAYEFVTLHQSADYYGVNSTPLGRGNNELATCAEIQQYYQSVMRQLQSTGRLTFLPQCEYKVDSGTVQSLLDSDLCYSVKVRKKTVDATFTAPFVPSTRAPEFGVGAGVNLVPVNGLSRITSPWKRYVIIGGGKTGIDAVLFLLDNNVAPEKVLWIVPNAYWLLNREFTTTDMIAQRFMEVMDCVSSADNAKDLYTRWEKLGWVMRIDESVEATALKGASASVEEVQRLKLVRNVVREGRIRDIEQHRIVFMNGTVMDTDSDTLHVDCSANGAKRIDRKPIFAGNVITLQGLRLQQDVYSASVIAEVERRYPDNEELKNSLKPIDHPQDARDYLVAFRDGMVNEAVIEQLVGMRWLRCKRLNYVHHMSLYTFIRWIVYFKRFGASTFQALNNIVEKMGGK